MRSRPAREFVVVSGLPGSGKSTLARRLAPALHLPLIDKDAILERLFGSRGLGDARWAVLVSLWHVPGVPADLGTPTGWLLEIPGKVVHVYCACEPEVSAELSTADAASRPSG